MNMGVVVQGHAQADLWMSSTLHTSGVLTWVQNYMISNANLAKAKKNIGQILIRMKPLRVQNAAAKRNVVFLLPILGCRGLVVAV